MYKYRKDYSAKEIYKLTMEKIVPLPCQRAFAEELASIISMHLKKNRLIDEGFDPKELPDNSSMVIASTGAGKTFIIKEMCRLVGVNLIVIDGTDLCHTGWRGVSLGTNLLNEMEHTEEEEFKRSILFIDEADKLRFYFSEHDQGNPMENLLQLFNNDSITSEISGHECKKIDVSRFTVIFAGAFQGLSEIISSRISAKPKIGFMTGNSPKYKCSEENELLSQCTTEDLTKYGMLRELVGRCSSIVHINDMQLEDYKLLLKEPHGVLSRYKTYLNYLFHVDIEVTDSAIEMIAKKSQSMKTGARAVNNIIGTMMRKAISDVENDESINKVILDVEEDEPLVKYKYGVRTHLHIDRVIPEIISTNLSDEYVLVADSIPDLLEKLIQMYKQTGETHVVEMENFMGTALYYLDDFCDPMDFRLTSLKKLANTIIAEEGKLSTFDIMIKESTKSTVDTRKMMEYYLDLKREFTNYTTGNIYSGLKAIKEKMKEKYNGCSNIKFHIEHNDEKQ